MDGVVFLTAELTNCSKSNEADGSSTHHTIPSLNACFRSMCTSSEPSIKGIIGMGLEAPLHAGDAMRLYDLINSGPFDDALYRQLAAVVASIFARMAVRERSATGRTRRVGSEGQEPVALEAFVHNGLVPPRVLVATLVRTACSVLTGARLITIERARVQQSTPIAHVLARGRDQGAVGGEQHVLVRFDALGLCWLPEERLRTFPSGERCIEQYDALKLDGFGSAPLEHLLVVQALEPTLQCAKCEYWRPELATPGPPISGRAADTYRNRNEQIHGGGACLDLSGLDSSPSWAWGCPQHRGGQEVSHLVTYLGVYESPVCLQVCVCPRSARRDSALYCPVLILYCTGMYAFASLRREEWRIPGTKTRAIT